MIQTVSRKRIEILVDTPLVPRVVAQLKAVDISGWSVIHVASGGGRAGVSDTTPTARENPAQLEPGSRKAAEKWTRQSPP